MRHPKERIASTPEKQGRRTRRERDAKPGEYEARAVAAVERSRGMTVVDPWALPLEKLPEPAEEDAATIGQGGERE